jgi:hypothetical protein
MNAYIARGLFLSGLFLAVAVGIYLEMQSNYQKQASEQLKSLESSRQPLLCDDPTKISTLVWDEDELVIKAQRSDRWRLADGTLLEAKSVDVRLAQLRGSYAEIIDASSELSKLGLEPAQQKLTMKIGGKTCSLSLGFRHPTTDMYAVAMVDNGALRLGWVKLKQVSGKNALMALSGFTAHTVLPISPSSIDVLSFTPQVGSAPFELKRQRGFYDLSWAQGSTRADGVRSQALIGLICSLSGDLLLDAPVLEDADLIIEIREGANKHRLEFFHRDESLYARIAKSVFRLKETRLADFLLPPKSLRNLQVIDYDRSQLAVLELRDDIGGLKRYRRELAGKGLDPWFEKQRRIQKTHILSAMQWDLHHLRAEQIVDDAQALTCADNCQRVRVFDFTGKVLIDLRLQKHNGAYLAQQGEGPVFKLKASDVDRWPFGELL